MLAMEALAITNINRFRRDSRQKYQIIAWVDGFMA
jgi:hypothetical protein